MKVRLLKDWNFQKCGQVVEVYEPTAKNWIATGIAEPASMTERRDVQVETADSNDPESVERAVQKPRRGKRR